MQHAVFYFAWKEWRRSLFGTSLKGVGGARDLRLLACYVGIVALLAQLSIAAFNTVPLRIEQSLLGSIEQGQRPIRLTRNYLRTDGVDAGTHLLMRNDPSLEGLYGVPQRSYLLGGSSAIDWPFEIDRQKTQLEMIALAETSPLWGWALGPRAGLSRSPQGDAIAEGVVFERIAIGNSSVLDRILPPSVPWNGGVSVYETYREAIAGNLRFRTLARDLPERIESWSDLDRLVLRVKERIGGEWVEQLHPFEVEWREGLPLPENAAFLLPLSFVDAVEAAAHRSDFSFAAAGGGEPVGLFRAIRGELYDDMESETSQQIMTLFEQVAICLGGGSETPLPLELDGTFSVALKAGTRGQDGLFQNSWSGRELTECLERVEAPKELQALQPGFLNRVYFEGQGSHGMPVRLARRNGELAFGLLETPCAAMERSDRHQAIIIGHAAMVACDLDGAGNGAGAMENGSGAADAPVGAIFLYPYDFMSFIRDSEAGRAAPDSEAAMAALLGWTVAKTREALGGPVYFDPDRLNGAARDLIAKANKERALTASGAADTKEVFVVDEGYAKAVVQYDLMMTMLSFAAISIAAIVVLSMAMIIGFKLSSTLGYRLSQYALYSSYGFSGRDLSLIVYSQVVGSALAGLVAAAGLNYLIVAGLNWATRLRDLPERVRISLGLEFDPLFLAPGSGQLLLCSFVVLAAVLALTRLIECWLGISRASFPSDLVTARGSSRSSGKLAGRSK